MVAVLLYREVKPPLNMGEPTGEKVNCWLSGPAELMMGSLSRSKVLMLNGIGGCCACGWYVDVDSRE